MTFPELTRVMLNSMDFFELRRTAARYSVAFQGVRRQKLIRDLERKILAKSQPQATASVAPAATRYPEGATSAKPNLAEAAKSVKPLPSTRITTFSTRNALTR